MSIKRTAIILDKNLSRGVASSMAAILMGQAALCDQGIYATEPLLDLQGQRHAAIRFSTVVLKAGPAQILSVAQRVQKELPSVTCILFSRFGQGLPNAFSYYQTKVSGSSTAQLEPIGVLLVGDEAEVREVTKKFSLLD